MAHFLNASQLAECCVELGLEWEQKLLERACQVVAQRVSDRLGVAIVADADTQPGFAGLCVGFGPETEHQECPVELLQYDPGSDWAQGG